MHCKISTVMNSSLVTNNYVGNRDLYITCEFANRKLIKASKYFNSMATMILLAIVVMTLFSTVNSFNKFSYVKLYSKLHMTARKNQLETKSPFTQKSTNTHLLTLFISSVILSQTPIMTIATNSLIMSPLIAVTGGSSNSLIHKLSDVSFAKPEGVNKPELLPQDKSQVYPVIDVANFLRYSLF